MNIQSSQSQNLAGVKKLFNVSVTSWFVIAVLGQLIFATYVIAFYGRSTFSGQYETWNKVLPHGYVAGEILGNLIVGIHVILAAVILLGGPLQIIPQVRDRFRRFHRWNGRVYLLTAFIMSLTGLIMVWTRGTVGGTVQHISISINALLIMACAVMAYRTVRARDFERHRQWALRLYLVVSGVYFFRVGLMCWLLIHQRPVGFDPETFQGPFLTVLNISQYTLPLLLCELYFYTQKNRQKRLYIGTSLILWVVSLLMLLGIVGATMGMWWPRM